MTSEPKWPGFYAPWCDQPDDVKPMTDEELKEFARRAKELMEKKRRLEPRDDAGPTSRHSNETIPGDRC